MLEPTVPATIARTRELRSNSCCIPAPPADPEGSSGTEPALHAPERERRPPRSTLADIRSRRRGRLSQAGWAYRDTAEHLARGSGALPRRDRRRECHITTS